MGRARTRHAAGNRGQAIIAIVLFFVLISSIIAFGVAQSVFYHLKNTSDFFTSRRSYYLSEALAEDTVYRMMRAYYVPPYPSLTLDGATASATVTAIFGGNIIVSNGEFSDLYRRVQLTVTYGSGGSFFYGVQAGEGGVSMANSSSIVGNIASDGPINGSGNLVYGDVISAGPAGLIDGIHATSSAYAHTIQNSEVDRDAYFTVLTSTTVGGTQYPDSPDQATADLPISDSQISDWESDAAAGGTVTCTDGEYVIDSNVTIGPKKIPCDFVISGNPTVTLLGALWVTGDITTKNNPILKVSPILVNRTIPVIADNPSDHLNSSRVLFDNASEFQGSGSNSYILFVSQNNSAEQGGSVDAVVAGNSLTGEVLVYAPHGNISLSNTVNLREVTGYKLTLRNSAKIVYKSGLASILFSSGPSGGFNVTDWREVK